MQPQRFTRCPPYLPLVGVMPPAPTWQGCGGADIGRAASPFQEAPIHPPGLASQSGKCRAAAEQRRVAVAGRNHTPGQPVNQSRECRGQKAPIQESGRGFFPRGQKNRSGNRRGGGFYLVPKWGRFVPRASPATEQGTVVPREKPPARFQTGGFCPGQYRELDPGCQPSLRLPNGCLGCTVGESLPCTRTACYF